MTEAAHAFLLRAIDYRDADRIVTLMTREHGRLGAIARGARRSRRRFAGTLEPCMKLRVELAFGRGELATLKESTVVRAFPKVLDRLDRIRAGGAALEFTRAIAPEREPEPDLFDSLEMFFEAIGESEDPGMQTLAFSAHALAIIGLTPGLERCGVSGQPCPAGRPALFDPTRGTIVSRLHGGGSVRLEATTRQALITCFGPAWAGVRWTESGRTAAAEALTAFVDAHLGRKLSTAWRASVAPN